MRIVVLWRAKAVAGYPAKHYVVRKDSGGNEAYLHCVRILIPNKGKNNPPNTIKVFKQYALIEYWEYYTMETWETIFEAIMKIKKYGAGSNQGNK